MEVLCAALLPSPNQIHTCHAVLIAFCLYPLLPRYVVLLKEGLVAVAREYAARGFKAVAISSNSIETHPQVRARSGCRHAVIIMTSNSHI